MVHTTLIKEVSCKLAGPFDGPWNYLLSSGAMKTRLGQGSGNMGIIWIKYGIMLTGRQDINGVRYYLNA